MRKSFLTPLGHHTLELLELIQTDKPLESVRTVIVLIQLPEAVHSKHLDIGLVTTYPNRRLVGDKL